MDKEIDKIKLRPLTEGLGLNHFSEGLPYTPSSNVRRPMVQFNFPAPRPPRAERPQEATAPLAEPKPSPSVELDLGHHPAGLFRRLLAYVIDLVAAVGIYCGIVWGSFSYNGFNIVHMLRKEPSAQILIPLALLYFVVHLGYFLIQETTWRTTLGKLILGMRIESHSGFTVIARVLCFFISAIPFGVGLVWGLFSARNRCWHDGITDSEVILS